MNVFFVKKVLLGFVLIVGSLMADLPDIPKDHKLIKCTFKKINRVSRNQSHPNIPFATKAKSALAYSSNWSGYAAETSMKKPASAVTAVCGSWIVPVVKAVRGKKITYCAIWVGIDGYSSDTVEQIGTEHDCVNGIERSYAWFEMYPNGSYLIGGFPVRVGDVISASVTYNNGIFTMQIHNITRKVSTIIPTSYTTLSTAKRISAEWIVEAPYFNSVLPLANFGTIFISNCSATINNISGNINNKAWVNIPIEMVTSKGIPKAIPSPVGNNGLFTVTWNHI